MARTQVVIFKDDIDGTEGDIKTVRFGVNDDVYEIDLSPANRAKLWDVLAPFVQAGTKVSGRGRANAISGKGKPGYVVAAEKAAHLKAVREWVRDNGWEVKPNGRVPAHMVTAYNNGKNVAQLDDLCKRIGTKTLTVVQSNPAPAAPAALFQTGEPDKPAPAKRTPRKAAPKKAPAKAAAS